MTWTCWSGHGSDAVAQVGYVSDALVRFCHPLQVVQLGDDSCFRDRNQRFADAALVFRLVVADQPWRILVVRAFGKVIVGPARFNKGFIRRNGRLVAQKVSKGRGQSSPNGFDPARIVDDERDWFRSSKGHVVTTPPLSSSPVAVLDVRVHDHEDVLRRVEHVLDLRLDRSSVVYGDSGATEGFRTSNGTWARVERRNRWRINSAVWVGLEAASTVKGVKKPEWFQGTTWADNAREVVWRADEVELISALVVGDLANAATLPDAWWATVRDSLTALAAHQTERVGMTQAHLTKRISEVFDGVNTTVDDWTTAHADVHWGNLSVEGHLIDWEDWGAAPRGLDAATLWQSALPDAAVAARVQHEFGGDLRTRSGRLSQLLVCANAIRIAARRGKPTPLSEPAKAAAQVLVAELRA
ncbi:hypothetical protein [Amycolatopsis sp. H20-H5]|uniref:hypothetical protein n=1 Tax=Amycolatopsis sp. H20-H5 TaxID=3046309 RepID=UPI002DBF6C3B|nr:hypothetical protein [Amycolatopsis sp. H20-H5]MEC3979296.1 hypothetical protein [Amycolatopsis sp. H20-H5]